MAHDSSAARNEFFKKLKPRCISINNLAVRSADKKASAKDLILVTEDLSRVLDGQVEQNASVLDEKLADYVFFPLSNILRNQQQFPIRLTELTVKCLGVLVQYGWKSKIPKDLAQQLLILLTFVIGGVPGQDRKVHIPEEAELESFKTLTAIINAWSASPSGVAALVETSAIPSLGHAITVVLDGVTEGKTPEIQQEALETLHALLAAIKDRNALATFLPGVVSSLSRLLAPPSSLKTKKKVLVRGIAALQLVLTTVLGDIKIVGIIDQLGGTQAKKDLEGKVLTSSWLRASVAKIKIALANVLKLRNHGSDDVRSALGKLCIALIDECHKSLANCQIMVVETAMILTDSDKERSTTETTLSDLARIYPDLADTIKSTIYNWVTSLPRLLQSGDEKNKQQAIRNLVKGRHFISDLQIDSSILDNSLAASLRDGITALMITSKPSGVLSELPSERVELQSMELGHRSNDVAFQPVLIAQETEHYTRSTILDFIAKAGPVSQQSKLASEMLSYVRESAGPSQIASYWLAFELVKAAYIQSSNLDDFLDFSSVADTSDDIEFTFQELYSFSVAVIDSQAETDDTDWRLQALALEVTAFAAARMQDAFRPELIDVLYPVTTFLGSSVPQLREHAIISLNSISTSCGYANVTDLIIANVDYMVNSVSLRLNTFDITPASTQVLRMMIRLTGPKIIPYLEDVVASIFAALDNYHGYTAFVESLFSVLTEVVCQGARSDTLLIASKESASPSHKKIAPDRTTIKEICGILDDRTVWKRIRLEEKRQRADEENENHPARPWKAAKDTGPEEGEEDEANTEVEKPSPPKTRTFNVLIRVTHLTQNYLTSPTPTLRKSLLDLLTTVCPTLSPDEEAFLPLVNSVWPVLVERLYDPETFVVVAACKALSTLCECAGDFLSTRIKTEWWDNLGKRCRKAKAEVGLATKRKKGDQYDGKMGAKGGNILIPIRSQEGGLVLEGGGDTAMEKAGASSTRSGLGKFTQAAQLWEATQGLLIAIISFVRVDDEIFEEILQLLGDHLLSDPTAMEAVAAVDADVVWLLMYTWGLLETESLVKPVMSDGTTFVDL